MSALRRAGYHTSQCHCDPLALKTDAPGDVVFDVFRFYFREKQLKEMEECQWIHAEGFLYLFLSLRAKCTVGVCGVCDA